MNNLAHAYRKVATLLAVLPPLLTGLTSGTPVALADGSGTYPDAPFNGMQIRYVISGATVTSQEDSFGFTTSRTLKGTLDSGTLHVSGRVSMGNGFGARATVTLESDGQRKQWSEYLTTPRTGAASESFDLTVQVPSDATTASVTINMTGDYNVGTRGLIVNGTFVREAPRAAPRPDPTIPAQPPAPKPTDAGTPDLSTLILASAPVVAAGSSSRYRVVVENVGDGDVNDFWVAIDVDIQLTVLTSSADFTGLPSDQMPVIQQLSPSEMSCEIRDLRTDLAIQLPLDRFETNQTTTSSAKLWHIQCDGKMVGGQQKVEVTFDVGVPGNIGLKTIKTYSDKRGSDEYGVVMDGELKISAYSYTARDITEHNNLDAVTGRIESPVIRETIEDEIEQETSQDANR